MTQQEQQDLPIEGDELIEKVVHINRVAKVVKGGRRFNFSALVVVGDGKGRVGVGYGKANEVPEAIRKGNEKARASMFAVPLQGRTIPHENLGVFGSGAVLLRPASPGTGVIAGGPVRALMEALGVKDVLTKCIGTNNPNNVLLASMSGLTSLRSPEQIAVLRPRVIVALGATAVKGLLGETAQGITRLRGTWQQYEGIRVMPTFHPSYLLRTPSAKREAWEDLKAVLAFLG